MSFSGPSSGITFSGLVSGIDTDSIVTRILNLQRVPIQRLQIQQAGLRQQLGAMDQYKSLLDRLRTAATALNTASTFDAVSASSSASDVATVSAGTGAQPGTYRLSVTKLAQAHKLGTAAQADATSALNLTGSFIVNGKAISVTATDTLTSIASKVNAAGAGVTASVINGGANNVFLTLTATDSGLGNRIQLSDLNGGTVLQTLGVLSGAAAIANSVPNGAQSGTFADTTTTVGTLLGATVAAGSIQINGVSVAVDFATDSLSAIAANINAAGTGATASIVSETKNGATVYRLKIVGAATPTFTDANGMLENLGVLQRPAGNEMLAAQDAAYALDGVNLTSSTNSITGVIAGTTLTLLKANPTTPETTTITLARDTSSIRGKMDEFVTAYNAVRDFLAQAASFDSETLASGPLFGDSTISLVQDRLFGGLLQSPAGITGSYPNLLAIGLDFDSKGKMMLDASKFEAALSSGLDNVISLFTERGRIGDADIAFLSGTSKTKPSGIAGYEVIITQLATLGTATAGTAHTSASAGVEQLTFNGSAFGNSAYTLNVHTGSTLDDLVSQINSDSRLKDIMVASKSVDDKLVLTSKKYGTPGSFTVKSDLTAAADNSGVGTADLVVAGLNVQGTINGEAATGLGQLLTGDSGNTNTDGLQIRVTGGALGSRGTLVYTKGAAAIAKETLDGALDFVSGFLTADSTAIQGQIDDLDSRITRMNENISRNEQSLRAKFQAMENAISQLNAQSSRLGSLLNGLSSKR
jgi:flagellar hook-associated protein 2